MNISPKSHLTDATATATDITADLESFSQTPTAQFVVLERSAEVIFLDGDNAPEILDGNFIIRDISGEAYKADGESFLKQYELFRGNNDVTIYASKALGTEENKTDAFLDFAAQNANQSQGVTADLMSTLVNKDEQVTLKAKAQAGLPSGARSDCSANGTNAVPDALKHAA